MKLKKLTPVQKSVYQLIEKEALTNLDILHRIEGIHMMLSLNKIIEELKSLGIARSFMSGNMRYYVACKKFYRDNSYNV